MAEPTSDITQAMITPILADAKLELKAVIEDDTGVEDSVAEEVADSVIDEAIQEKEDEIKFYMVSNDQASP